MGSVYRSVSHAVAETAQADWSEASAAQVS